MSSSKTLDSSLYFDSFVTLFEELDGAPLNEDLSDHLVKRVRKNHSWFLDSVSRFRNPSAESKLALDSKEIVIGDCTFEVKKEIKEASFRASQCLCLDEVQSYILVSRVCELDDSAVDIESQEFLNLIALQYYHERQCLLKCIRHVFVHAVYMGKGSSSSGDATVVEAMQLVHDGLEMKLLSILTELLSSATTEKSEVDFTILWIEESVIEENLVLDILFLLYYDNFCCCNFEQWTRLCSIFKDILSGSFNTTIFAVSLQNKASFDHAKSQLLLILIETLDLENLLQMIHDEISFSQRCSFSLSNVQEMDVLVSSFSGLGRRESGPLFLAWAIFTCLLSSLPERDEHSLSMEIDHTAYLRQAFEAGAFDYLLEILRSDALRNSDGPVSGYLSILRTVISAFIASYELNHQTAENLLNLILDILSEIYREEDSLSMQFWDKDSCVDEPIRSLLNMLANEYPFHMLELVRLLSALCSGTWSAECVFNFLEKMGGVTLLSEIPRRSQFMDIYDTIEAQTQLNIPSIEGIVIPAGARGHIVRVIDVNSALVHWEFEHSGLFLLLLHLSQMSNSCKLEEVYAIVDLLSRMVSSSKALCFSLLSFEKSIPIEATQKYQRIEMNVRVDLIMTICNVAFSLVQDVNDSHSASICINILAEMLKCAPCHVTEVVSRSKIFGTLNFGYSSSWLLSGGLARMLLADHGENGDCSHLATSVLDFTLQLVEKGGDGSLCSTFVVFCLQYILVNHMQWKYRTKHARWKVTLKVLEVMKGCIKAIQSSHKLGLMIQDILYSDTSIHCFLSHILCTSPTELERSNAGHQYDVKETECLQLAVHSGLYIVHTLLSDFLKLQGPTSTAPMFVQIVLASTTKPVPIATAAMMWLNFVHDSEIQLAAAKVLSNLIVVGSMVQPYKTDNVNLVVSSTQIRNLKTTFFSILEDTMSTNEDLLTAMFDLLISAAHHQPTFLNSLILTEDVNETISAGKRKSSIDLIFDYIKRSETLIRSSPKVLLSFLNFLKALWDEGIQYLLALEKFRCSEIFWKHMALILAIEVKADLSSKNLSANEVQCTSHRYLCQGTVLEILTSEMFLLGKLAHNEISEKNNCTANSNDQNNNKSIETSMTHSIDVLSTCFGNSTMGNLLKVYPSNDYNEEVIVLAKKSVCMFIVHLIDKLSTADTGSLSLSVVRNISSLSLKLYEHPAFAALLAHYSSQGYSNEGKQLNHLVLNDLYYHLQGELEGRHITQGPFQELAQFLLEFEFFQCGVCSYENDSWTSADVINMFDIKQVSTEIGLELWEYSGWKTSVEVAERTLQHMQNANMIMSLSICKKIALKALVSVIYEYNGNVVKTKSRMFDSVKIEPSTMYVCKCLQATGDALLTTLCPPHILQEQLVIQAELLLNLSITIFRQNLEMSNRKKFLPLTLLCIKTSASCIKLLSDVRPSSTMLNKAVKILLTLLLISIRFIYYAEGKAELEVDQFSEASFTSSALLPILCRYVDHAELSVLSVALIDLMLKSFLTPNTWLPILESHLHLQNIAQIIQQKDDILSVCVYLNFLLTLARTKSGARMLYAGNIFSGLKHLLNNSLNPDNFNGNNNEKPEQIWGCCLAIITSMIHSLGDDPSFIDVIDNTVCYFFSEKDYILSYILSTPTLSFDEYNKKRARDQKTGASLTSVRLTEQTLTLVCVLVKHQSSWTKGMKEIESQLSERCIHLLAFISKGMQRCGDSPNKYAPTFCAPILKEETDLNEEPSFIGSKQGWFRICSAGLSAKAKFLSSLAVVVNDSENADMGRQSSFSDMVAIHMYRIALLLLKVLCMLAKAAAKRAEELEFIDLAYFPELPMPEILHGIQDQAIAIVTELCEAHKHKAMQQESENACFLLLQILEKALYLELCVSQSCGLRPVLGRIEDFSKAIKLLMLAMEQHSKFKVLWRSLSQIITLVYPGLLQSGR